MNKKFAIETRHSTLRQYKENYESDLIKYLESHEDNTQVDLLKIDLFSHKEFLKYLKKSSGYVTNEIEEGELNQRKINSQNRIIEFIENKIDECTNIEAVTNPNTLTNPSSLKWHGTPLQFTELIKPLYELGLLGAGLTQKETFEKLRLFFEIENFDESDKLKQIRKRINTPTPFLNTLETTLINWIDNKN